MGVLLRNAPSQIRNWLLVHMKEDTPYTQIREAIRSWDVQTYKWSDSIQYYQRRSEGSSSEAVPMEVDRVEKGKSKGKGKKGKSKGKDAKGKGKSWSSGYGYSPDKGKGKCKDKGKGKRDPDSKGKAKGKGKTTPKENRFYCGKQGLRQADCWKKQTDEGKSETGGSATKFNSLSGWNVNDAWTVGITGEKDRWI